MNTAQTSEPPVLFLDMNVWVAMAKGIADGAAQWIEAADALERLRKAGELVVPLIAAHYLELWHRGTQESREDIGRLMRDISGYATFAPLPTVRTLEVEASVARVAGGDDEVGRSDVLGRGAAFAFDSRFGRFRFVESLASPDGLVPEGRRIGAPDNLAEMDLSGPGWEWSQLVGWQELLNDPGIERRPEHRFGSAGVAEELELRDLLQREGWARERLRDFLVVDELTSLRDATHRACWGARVQPHALYLENPAFETPAEAMRAFVRGMPSVDVLATLREWKHRDLGHPWEQHDQTDLHVLSTVIPYADIVVTERRWAHMAKASRLTTRYGAKVCGLSQFATVLNDLSAGR